MQAKTPTEDYVGGVKLTLPKNVLIDSNEKLKELKLPKSEQLFVHSRSAGKNGQNPQVLILSADGKTSYTLDLTKLDLKKVRDFLTTNYQLPTTKLVGHDVKSTLKLLKSLGCEKLPEVGHDVLVGAFLINALVRAQSLTDLATADLKFDGAPLEDLPPEDFVARAPEFIAIIHELYLHQKEELKKTAQNSKGGRRY